MIRARGSRPGILRGALVDGVAEQEFMGFPFRGVREQVAEFFFVQG